MPDPVVDIVLKVLNRDCAVHSCPYRYGDEAFKKRLSEKLAAKLKHRVSDGQELKKMEKRIKDLEQQNADLKDQVKALKQRKA